MEPCCIVYGSETGSTEIAAYSTYSYMRMNGIPVEIHLADLVDLSLLLSFDYVIFFVPTCAYGEFPHNFETLVTSMLNYHNNNKFIRSFKYTIFGLGDSRYPLYNFASRRLQSLLVSLKASEFFPLALGDDQHPVGYDGELLVWRNDLINFFKDLYKVDSSSYMFEEQVFPFKVEILDSSMYSFDSSRSSYDSSRTNESKNNNNTNTSRDSKENNNNENKNKDKENNNNDDDEEELENETLLEMRNNFLDNKNKKLKQGSLIKFYKRGRACYTGLVGCNKIISGQTHFSNVRTIIINGEPRTWNTGDVFCLFPRDKEVSKLLRNIRLDPNQIIMIESNNMKTFQTVLDLHNEYRNYTWEMFVKKLSSFDVSESLFKLKLVKKFLKKITGKKLLSSRRLPVGVEMTLSELFGSYLCLKNICTPFQMYVMSFYTDDLLHKDKLLEMSNDTLEGCLEYYRYCKSEKRSLYDVLYDFPSVNLPLEVLINICTPYYSRLYSIASSELDYVNKYCFTLPNYQTSENYPRLKAFLDFKYKKTRRIELCVADVKYNTPCKRSVDGLASKYLSNLKLNDEVDYLIYKPSFPSILLDISVPVLFICTGTGVTVPRPYIEHRSFKFKEMWKRHKVLPTTMDLAFMGFRRPNQDHLFYGYRLYSNWCRFIFVYSRIGDKKFYVQDSIKVHSKEVYWLLRDGIVLIGGKSHPMPSQVLEALAYVMEKEANFSKDSAQRYIDDSVKQNKIIIDTWG